MMRFGLNRHGTADVIPRSLVARILAVAAAIAVAGVQFATSAPALAAEYLQVEDPATTTSLGPAKDLAVEAGTIYPAQDLAYVIAVSGEFSAPSYPARVFSLYQSNGNDDFGLDLAVPRGGRQTVTGSFRTSTGRPYQFLAGSMASSGVEVSGLRITIVEADQPAAANTMKTPVLLVHGLNSDRHVFSGPGWTAEPSAPLSGPRGFTLLRANSDLFGEATPVYVVDYSGFEGAHGDISASAQSVYWAIAQIKEQTGADKVFVVVHSMGGLLTRVYLEGLGGLNYRKDVAGLVTLDTPHMGCEFSDSGGFGLNEAASRFTAGWSESRAGQQMDPDSDFLNNLNAADYIDPTVPSTFVVGNHYPLLGDGLLSTREQIPYMTSPTRLHGLRDYRIEFVDAVHSPEIGMLYYQAILAAEGKATGSGSTLRPIVGTQEAKAIAKAAYDNVAVTFATEPRRDKVTFLVDGVPLDSVNGHEYRLVAGQTYHFRLSRSAKFFIGSVENLERKNQYYKETSGSQSEWSLTVPWTTTYWVEWDSPATPDARVWISTTDSR